MAPDVVKHLGGDPQEFLDRFLQSAASGGGQRRHWLSILQHALESAPDENYQYAVRTTVYLDSALCVRVATAVRKPPSVIDTLSAEIRRLMSHLKTASSKGRFPISWLPG